MESAAIVRSFRESFLPKPTSAFVSGAALRSSPWRVQFKGQSLVSLRTNQKQILHVKALETSKATSDAETIKENLHEPLEKSLDKSVFPDGLEMMLQEVCDTTEVAEVILKIGDFEMHLKRDIGNQKTSTSVSPSIESPTVAPPIPSEPMVESAPPPPPVVAEKSVPSDYSPFTNVSAATTTKLAALEASGSNAYVLVSSPTVGIFRRGRTLKGKRQPPSCKEGDIIKEGQIIGFLEQFGNELPVRSDVAGEVLKVLYIDGEAVGYGDPLVAVLPAFHGIK